MPRIRRRVRHGDPRSRRSISTSGPPRSTAAPTKSRRTSSPRRSWGSRTVDFDLTEEQQLLKNTVERLIETRYGFEQRAVSAGMPLGWSPDVWRQFAELGLLALPFDPEQGGLGGGGVEMMTLLEAFGSGLVVEPFLATVVLAGGALRLGASRALLEKLVPEIAGGAMLLAYAHGEPQSRYRLS